MKSRKAERRGKGVRMMIRELPVFRGYTVDERLREFRKVEADARPEFISFDSELGRELRHAMIVEAIEEHLPGHVLYLGGPEE